MQGFEFYNPTRIVFGAGKIAELARLVPANARVLVLYGGGSIKQNGTLDEVRAALHGHDVREFGGIEPNPRFETLLQAVEIVKTEQIDFLLAVGGGSVIDGTKFVAAAARYAGNDPWDILTTFGSTIQDAVPLGSVLTLPATGSEMNNGAVISRAGDDKLFFGSERTFPAFSILDPTKTYTLPPRQIANGAVDAFVHVMEQYLTYPAGALVQDRFAEGLLQTLIEVGPQALATPTDYTVRANLMWSATLALNGLIGAGAPQDWATHMLGHELTAVYGLDHAQTLAIVLPAMLQVRRADKRAKLLQYAERVWGLHEGSDDARIDAAIAHTRDFFERMGNPTHLAAYQIGSDAVERIVGQLARHGMTQLGERQDVTLDVSRRVLEASL
ncbi:NADP-dependent alcohol dehydrogenase [Andreprevotia lacus DSM 23236]|jgi:NADP-dependent alcohol dehydrogenase|uniref:NADP-dependent alcohol dehydrogenase n=1 Tax=Andreprevotia lacus DSM 23236 TaxID=1121001 RepID=A0A1W1X655_9NEIS|nr:iron-containing alcohol dehydrogenase [Andreprevotia lacus]SMC19208.1 NADP-dependent alcohol dehydrogenase [Andreprevotia lacus DSM 23236]